MELRGIAGRKQEAEEKVTQTKRKLEALEREKERLGMELGGIGAEVTVGPRQSTVPLFFHSARGSRLSSQSHPANEASHNLSFSPPYPS